METVLFVNPFLIATFSVSLTLMIVDIIFEKPIFILKIIYGLLIVAGVTSAILIGSTYQEIIIVILLHLIIALFYFYHRKEENKA